MSGPLGPGIHELAAQTLVDGWHNAGRDGEELSLLEIHPPRSATRQVILGGPLLPIDQAESGRGTISSLPTVMEASPHRESARAFVIRIAWITGAAPLIFPCTSRSLQDTGRDVSVYMRQASI